MQTRQLGELQVSALGLGCISMSQSYGAANREESERALHRALDVGYTFLDTPSLYGLGHNETLIGEVLPGRSEEFVLASKCGIVNRDGSEQSIAPPITLRKPVIKPAPTKHRCHRPLLSSSPRLQRSHRRERGRTRRLRRFRQDSLYRSV